MRATICAALRIARKKTTRPKAARSAAHKARHGAACLALHFSRTLTRQNFLLPRHFFCEPNKNFWFLVWSGFEAGFVAQCGGVRDLSDFVDLSR